MTLFLGMRPIFVPNLFCDAMLRQDGGQVRFDAGRRNEFTHPTFNITLRNVGARWWASSFRRWASKRTYPPYI